MCGMKDLIVSSPPLFFFSFLALLNSNFLVNIYWQFDLHFNARPQQTEFPPPHKARYWCIQSVCLLKCGHDGTPYPSDLPQLRPSEVPNLACGNNLTKKALQQSQGSAGHSCLYQGDWSVHIADKKKIPGIFLPSAIVKSQDCRCRLNSVKLSRTSPKCV